MTATTEFVVPKSIPIILPIKIPPGYKCLITKEHQYNSTTTIRYECVVVKVLDGRCQGSVARENAGTLANRQRRGCLSFGNLGQDVLGAFKSYTSDFQNMTFTARK
jgi:hypothetical protein